MVVTSKYSFHYSYVMMKFSTNVDGNSRILLENRITEKQMHEFWRGFKVGLYN